MDDLFELFPDLPWPGRIAASARSRGTIDERIDEVRRQVQRNAASRRAVVRLTNDRLNRRAAALRRRTPRH